MSPLVKTAVMLSVCPVMPPPPPPPPLPPPHPATPATTMAKSTIAAQAYFLRSTAGMYIRFKRKKRSITAATIPAGSTHTRGVRFQPDGGAMSDSEVVVIVAVHEGGLVPSKAVCAVHVTGVERLFEPFLNCTVPVGPAPLLVGPMTSAVSVTVPPAVVVVGLAETLVWVAAAVMVIESVLLVACELKLDVEFAV